MKPLYPLIALDRDGVINHDSPNYIRSPSDFEPIPGSLEAIAQLNRQGIRVAVATNQSAIGRGYIDLQTLEAIHRKMTSLLAEKGGRIDFITFCPHLPQDGCGCRKPAPGLLQNIAQEFSVETETLVFVGDSATDMEAAQRAGATGVLVRTGNGREHEQANRIAPDVAIFENLWEVVENLLSPTDLEGPEAAAPAR